MRTSFNIAIGADGPDTQRTARSALLQMLNTTFKRVTLLPMVGPICVSCHSPSVLALMAPHQGARWQCRRVPCCRLAEVAPSADAAELESTFSKDLKSC